MDGGLLSRGKQTIGFFFDEPQRIRRIWLQFVELHANAHSSSPCNGPRIRRTRPGPCFSNSGISVPAARQSRSEDYEVELNGVWMTSTGD